MKTVLDNSKNIYIQIQETVEDDIISGAFVEDELIPSTNQFAKFYGINPATAAKGITVLAEEGILYKKRGIGMCVSPGARKIILDKRKKRFVEVQLDEFLREANKLGISVSELKKMLEEKDNVENN